MKLTHDMEAHKGGAEDANGEKRGFAKAPLSERLMKWSNAKVLGLVLAAAAPTTIAAISMSSCTFSPAGITETQDGDTDATHDAGPDADVDADMDADVHDSGPDADTDADVDSGMDSGPDADVDADTDADVVDSGPDADTDADVTDSGPDADVDADTDADVVDSGPDADTDADVDAGPVACVVSSTGTFNSSIAEGASQTVGGYVFTYLGMDGVDHVRFNITCGGNPVETDYSMPIAVKTTITVAIDGKKIEITPHFIEVDDDVNVGITVSAL